MVEVRAHCEMDICECAIDAALVCLKVEPPCLVIVTISNLGLDALAIINEKNNVVNRHGIYLHASIDAGLDYDAWSIAYKDKVFRSDGA